MTRTLLTTALIVAAYPALVRADVSPEDTLKANNLFEAGQKLIDAGKIDLACDSFEASLAIDPQIGTRLNLADCRERQGRLVDAFDLYTAAADEAARTNKAGRLKFARERADALAAKLVEVRLAIAVPGIEGLVIQLDGKDLPREQWEAVLRREAKPIVVDATAPGHTPYHGEVPARAGGKVVVEVPALVPLGANRPPPVTPPEVPITTDAPSRMPSTPTLVIGGAGAALGLGGIVLGLHARSRYHTELDTPGPDLNGRLDGPQLEADVATVLGIAGVVAIGVGVVLYVRERKDGVVVVPTAGTNSAGVTLSGSL